MKDVLEVVAVAGLHKDARYSFYQGLQFRREQGGDVIGQVIDELNKVLNEDGVKVAVSGREKQPHSIWRKMQRKNVAFEQLSDIMAFRVVVDSVQECYHALGKIGRASCRERVCQYV